MKGYKFTNKSQEPEFITRCLIKDKKSLLNVSMIMKKNILDGLRIKNKHSIAYYEAMESLLDGFIQSVTEIPIMTITDSWWHYSIKKSNDGLKLEVDTLSKVSFRIDDDNNVHFRGHTVIGNYEVLNKTFNKLTVEEYAEKYGVEPVTVRQWIRRGKLRSAEKIGNEWRIPESEDIPKRGYETGTYTINTEYAIRREAIPSEPYSFLKDTESLTIFQNKDDKNTFTVMYNVHNKWEPQTLELNTREREKLELFLISTPYFKCNGSMSDGSSYFSTLDGLSLFEYFEEKVSIEDLEKTGPGIEGEDQFDLNMKLDGFVMDDDKVYFPM